MPRPSSWLSRYKLFVLKTRAWLSGVLGILLAAMGGGCAGDGQPLSKDEYVARLNAMCEDFSAREQRIGEPQSVSDLVERGLIDAAKDDDLAAVRTSAAKNETLNEESNSITRELGATSCAGG